MIVASLFLTTFSYASSSPFDPSLTHTNSSHLFLAAAMNRRARRRRISPHLDTPHRLQRFLTACGEPALARFVFSYLE